MTAEASRTINSRSARLGPRRRVVDGAGRVGERRSWPGSLPGLGGRRLGATRRGHTPTATCLPSRPWISACGGRRRARFEFGAASCEKHTCMQSASVRDHVASLMWFAPRRSSMPATDQAQHPSSEPAMTNRTRAVGTTATRTRTITSRDIDLFMELTGDRKPLHYDAELAFSNAVRDVIVQGGVISGWLDAVLAKSSPGPVASSTARSRRRDEPDHAGGHHATRPRLAPRPSSPRRGCSPGLVRRAT